MIERPILFSAPMVRAILNGSKTMTRRVVKPQPDIVTMDGRAARWKTLKVYDRETRQVVERDRDENGKRFIEQINCPYGKPGDTLWVRETFQLILSEGVSFAAANYKTGEGYSPRYPATEAILEYVDEEDELVCRCTPSIHMPRWASRITLGVGAVRVERLQDLTDADLKAEGIDQVREEWSRHPEFCESLTDRELFVVLWESINGKDSWAKNPWVWVVEFHRIKNGEQP